MQNVILCLSVNMITGFFKLTEYFCAFKKEFSVLQKKKRILWKLEKEGEGERRKERG